MSAADLLALAERCEREPPNFLLDSAITLVMHPEYAGEGTATAIAKVHPYTSSLDAAVTLVPEGWVYSLNTFKTGASAYVMDPADRIVRTLGQYIGTPAMAICAAALRARASAHSVAA